ncbi:MAG: ATP-binding protein [Brevundimonas sp.]|jgi:hypothetical protein|uniref:DEAD/DEAH box helicase n=1 Tax=Brevundimonas sp. TaxID=1871086 RepID=UPI0025B7DE06|nr:AAA domain-containing protein [Brevundimonas sp.]MCH4267474.1 ATP-binding protein [Brevundimonas sp.]
MTAQLPERRVSKSKFSMYLRTNCDRELYLSLFSNNAAKLAAAGIPVPLKTRPGVQLITSSGREFEYEQFDILINALPSHVAHKSAGRTGIALEDVLAKAGAPTLILQPELEPEDFRDFTLTQLGVPHADLSLIPPLAGLRPDVILVDQRAEMEFEVLPNGSRKLVAPDDKRIPLCVIDLKNITEANASYAAEVCLYAVFLSSWLSTLGKAFKDKFFVSDRIYLWRHVEMPNFSEVMKKKEGGDEAARYQALCRDLEDGRVNYLVYMPSVRKFFVEDLPRVISTGDGQGWQAVDYHVNTRCGACDWLGNRTWLSDEDRVHFDKSPGHYCFIGAENSDHLCKMPSLSKGASRVLQQGGHPQVGKLVGINPSASVLRDHSLLKKDRTQIGQRAESITSNAVTVDQTSKVAGLAKYLGAEFDIIVNFDPGSGFLTGIGTRGTLFSPYGTKFANADGEDQSIKPLGEAAFVVIKDNLVAEWTALAGFIDRLAGWIDEAGKIFKDQGLGKLRTQICFWELRQYEELCNAFGRHLLEVLDLPARSQRALAWIFPADELMEKNEQICPNIVFIKDVATASVHLPQRFAVTLLGTAEAYHHDRLKPRKIDSYYVEPLGNSIPRERIFEIWKSPTGTVRMFGKPVSIIEAADRYGSALKAHAWAMSSIAARLRIDLKDCISGSAPELNMSIPNGLTSVAYDAKLWDRWSAVSAAVQKMEGMNTFIARPEWLEASYKTVILDKVTKSYGGHCYEFKVSADSTEAKIEDGDLCTLGIVSLPGFPLMKPANLGLAVNEYWPMHRVVAAHVETFDRAAGLITVRFEATWSGTEAVFKALMASGIVPIGKEPIYLVPTLPFDDSDETTEVLKAIGEPACASPAPEALKAMGAAAAKKLAKGAGPNPPIARVLWDADTLAKTDVRSATQADGLVAFASTANQHPLNQSQVAAVRECALRQIAIIWGPPGTGKTDTLVAYLHALVREGKPLKILIAGPNYRTVEELSGRLVRNLEGDSGAVADYFWLYSKSRDPKDVSSTNKNVNVAAVKVDGPGFDDFVASMGDPAKTTIVSTTAHILQRLTKKIANSAVLAPLFDVVVLDESSQIPVTLALKPMAMLKDGAQLIVAGDHKQMPPIQNLDPPKGAEYLVDSVQNYLIKRFKVAQQPLLVNYRSNEDLVAYAKSLGYPAGLTAASSKKDLLQMEDLGKVVATLPSFLPKTAAYAELLKPERRVTALIHDDPVSSQANDLEAGLVAGLAFVTRRTMAGNLDTGNGESPVPFTDDEFFESGIGIVTPHKAQKALVVRKLMELFPNAKPEVVYAAVDTVERFQGGERNLIIVSYGVGDTDIIEGEEEFLLQLERTNVAISRAKAKCIVLMPKTLAYHLPSDQEAAETSVALKSYLEEFCRYRMPTLVEGATGKKAAEVRWH